MKLAYQVATPEVLYQPEMTCLQGNFRQNIALLAELGYDAVELMTTEPASLDWDEIRDTVAGNGMSVALICTGEMAIVYLFERCQSHSSRTGHPPHL